LISCTLVVFALFSSLWVGDSLRQTVLAISAQHRNTNVYLVIFMVLVIF
jgi:hypothetical protein